MRRWLHATAAVLFGALPAYAQVGLPWPGPGTVHSVAAGYSGPGDIVSGATAWWGLRAYSATQADGTHKAIKILRTSDNETCDVFLNTSGQLGLTTACSGADNGVSTVTFCNATFCVPQTWYDQTGNGNDVVLNGGSSATGPVLTPSATISSQNVDWGSGNKGYCTAGNVAISNIVSASAVYNRTGAVSTNDIGGFGTTPTQFGGAPFADQAFMYAGTQVNETASDSAYHAFQFIFHGDTSSTMVVDTTTSTPIDVGTGAGTAKLCLGAGDAVDGNSFAGKARELGLWPNAAAATFASNVGSMKTNQATYWGF